MTVSDGIITSRMLLQALKQVRRNRKHLIERLDQQEPVLAEHVMEQLGEFCHRLWAAGLSDRRARRLYRQMEELVLTSIVAQRMAYRQLWEAGMQAETSGDEQAEDDEDEDSR